jgi:pilus assembly protein Flp/PilA
MNMFLKMIRDESGASAAEYALILAVVGVGIIVAALALGGAIGGAMNCAATTIADGTDACAATPAP